MQNLSRICSGLVLALGLAWSVPAAAADHHYHRAHAHYKAAHLHHDHHGRIARSQSAKTAFKHLHPCPANGHDHGACPGYVIDHINPLACGGPDDPSNMQWQTIAAGKAKDKWERIGC